MQLLTVVFDAILPPSAEQKILRQIKTEDLIKKIRPHKYSDCYALTHYEDPWIHALIIENKFHNNKRASYLLSNLLDHWLDGHSPPFLIIPIPLGTKRHRRRGHNQVESVVKCSRHHKALNTKLLYRQKETAPQSSLNRKQRQTNITHAFSTKTPLPKLDPKATVIILDDVLTTGTTLNTARATITPHLPPDTKLICLALAH